VRHAFVKSEAIGEHAVEDTYLLAAAQSTRLELDETRSVLALFQRRDYVIGDRERRHAGADKARHTDSGKDRAPALRLDVDRHEHVAWEERRRDRFGAARVTALLEVDRKSVV